MVGVYKMVAAEMMNMTVSSDAPIACRYGFRSCRENGPKGKKRETSPSDYIATGGWRRAMFLFLLLLHRKSSGRARVGGSSGFMCSLFV